MNKSIKYNLGQIEHNTRLVLLTFIPSTYTNLEPNITLYFAELNRFAKAKGLRSLVKRVKDTRVAVLRQFTGEPIQGEYPILLKEGWPLWLPFPKLNRTPGDKILPHQRDQMRLILTLLSCLRGIILSPVLDLDTVVKGYGGTLNAESIGDLRTPLRWLGVKTRNHHTFWSRFHFTTKSGPMGQALLSAIYELPMVLDNIELLADIKLIGGPRLANILDTLKELGSKDYSSTEASAKLHTPLYRSIPLRSDPCLGRIAMFGDKEGKTRVVAIFDYWTQTTLYSIHKILMGLLSKIPSDCTFNQSNYQRLSCLPGPYYSFDLSAATDRMPMWLQLESMKHIIGHQRAEAWARLLTSREFATKGRNLPRTVRYGCGQPMGAYSSWASMALTHHLIVQLAAAKVGYKEYFPNYVLLGDDIVIADSVVAESYRSLLSSLDMGISSVKTHVSLDSWEFAKRWHIGGSEVTPFSIGGLKSVSKFYFLLAEFLSNQASHGWTLLEQQVPGFVTELLRCYWPKNSSRKRRIQGFLALFTLFNHVKFLLKFSGDLRDPLFLSANLCALRSIGVLGLGDLRGFDPKFMLDLAFQNSKSLMAERDLGKFQEHLGEATKVVASWVSSNFPSTTQSTSPVSWLPVSKVLESILDSSIEALKCPDRLFEEGLSKHFITKGVFSEDAEKSRLRNQAGVTKIFIHEILLALSTGYIVSRPREVWSPKLTKLVDTARDQLGTMNGNTAVFPPGWADLPDEDKIQYLRYQFF